MASFLFCQKDPTFFFERLFVPSELMDALSDPRAFMSAQEKREQQMKAMGIETSDINTSDIKMSKNAKGGAKAAAAKKEKEEAGQTSY